MSEFTNRDIHRGDGVSTRGILISIAVILFVIVGLATLGGGGGAPADPAALESAPAAEPAPATAPVQDN